MNKYDKILDLIVNGVSMEDGNIRSFDVIDYFTITKSSYDKVFNSLKDKMNLEEIRKFKKFCKFNDVSKRWNERNIENKLSIKSTYGVLFDKNNKLIPGTGRTITNEENIAIINYIIDNKIPLCNSTFESMQRRVAFGITVFDNIEEDIKLRKLNK